MTGRPQNNSQRPQDKMEPSMVAHAWVCGCVDACHGTCGGQRMFFGDWFLHSVIWVLGIVLRWSALATSTFTPRGCLAGPLPLIIGFLLSFSRMFAKGIPTAEHASSQLSMHSLHVYTCLLTACEQLEMLNIGLLFTNSDWIWGDVSKPPFTPAEVWMANERNHSIQV